MEDDMKGFDNPYKKAQEIGFLGANHGIDYSVTEALETLKFDHREVGSFRIGAPEVTVYEWMEADPRFAAEFVEAENPARFTSFIFTKEPDEEAFETAAIIELDRLDLLEDL